MMQGPGPASFRELGIINGTLTRIGARVQGKKTLGVFATLGRAPRLFRAWLVYSAMMMPFGYLSRRETEMIILRVAHLRSSAYEADQHRKLAAKAGVSQGEIAALERTDHGFTGREGVLVNAVDALVQQRAIPAELRAQLNAQLSERQQVAFVMLVTNYDGLATALDVLGVAVDEER